MPRWRSSTRRRRRRSPKPWPGFGERGLSLLRVLLCGLNAKYVHTNLALRYLEALARRGGHEVRRMEFTINDRPETVEAEIVRAAPELLGFSCYIWNIAQVLEIAENVKKVRPAIKIVLGGPEVSFDGPAILAAHPAVDFVVGGEGEGPWTALLAAFPTGTFQDVPGLCWREGGAIRVTPPGEPWPLHALPSPAEVGMEDLAGRLVYYEASRGCPFSCAFCLSGREERVRFADPARVLRDMERLVASGALAVKFVDRTFNCRRDQAMAIWRGLLSYAGRMRFHFEIVAELLGEEELSFLATVPPGLFQFEIGVQSTNPATLAAIGRLADPDRLAANLRALREAGNIHLHLDFIAGLPYETYDRFLTSLDFALPLWPDAIQVGTLKMLSGSRLRDEAATLGYLYRRHPPYEVLANPWLDFTELTRLKVLARLVDLYYNEGRFFAALTRLFARVASPARLLVAFAAFSEKEGWHLRLHQGPELAAHLLRFAEEEGLADPVFRERLRLDLHCLVRDEKEPSWSRGPRLPELRSRWRSWLEAPENRAWLWPEFPGLGPREAFHRTKLLAFRHDPTAPPEEERPGPALVAVVYPSASAFPSRPRTVRFAPAEFGWDGDVDGKIEE
ncbi:MAG: DUF4080 domain-containing protein [Firmicutes bacterium]|nr:DUF4080 domain-containing protein [Bacillota bacterium]